MSRQYTRAELLEHIRQLRGDLSVLEVSTRRAHPNVPEVVLWRLPELEGEAKCRRVSLQEIAKVEVLLAQLEAKEGGGR